MNQPKSKQRHSVKNAGPSRSKSRPNQKKQRAIKTAPPAVAARADTKGARIVAMLRAPAGATIASMIAASGWQPHSVRGFLAGVVRKRLKLNLISEKGDGGRIYRVKDSRRKPNSNSEPAPVL
jgi:hypothetical protein